MPRSNTPHAVALDIIRGDVPLDRLQDIDSSADLSVDVSIEDLCRGLVTYTDASPKDRKQWASHTWDWIDDIERLSEQFLGDPDRLSDVLQDAFVFYPLLHDGLDPEVVTLARAYLEQHHDRA